MTLYFFVNHLLRRYLRKKLNPYNKSIKYEFEEDDSLFLNHEFFFTNDKEISKELSRLILKESFKQKDENMRFIYNELLYANKNVTKLVDKEINLNFSNLKYLFQVSKVYFLEENIVVLLDKLIKDPKNNFILIKRILRYSPFRDWITLKSYLSNYNNYISMKECNYYNHEIYHIYVMELYQSELFSYLEIKPYIELAEMGRKFDPISAVKDFLKFNCRYSIK